MMAGMRNDEERTPQKPLRLGPDSQKYKTSGCHEKFGMKLQYLGDSKDSFKWDYHDYLVDAMGYELLNIVLMMTPNDGRNHGQSRASLYPARESVLKFCGALRESRDLSGIHQLPLTTCSKYSLALHSLSHLPGPESRLSYFDGFSDAVDQVVLVDPDNGLEPQKSYSEKHLLYSELNHILTQLSQNSIISVFQHFRRKPFAKDFVEICDRIFDGFVTAIYWHSLMFVQLTRADTAFANLMVANRQYAKGRPVKLLACV